MVLNAQGALGRLTGLLLLTAVAAPLCLAQTAAATVISVAGRVNMLRENTLWALELGDTVQVGQVIVTGPDGMASFQVADGSTFEVFPNSRVTFRANPGNLRDLVDVWIGRVRVHIQKLFGQPNPNKVHTPTAIISVRGTIFDVRVDPEDETTVVIVEEGQVAVEHKLMPRDGDPKVLNAGDALTVYRNVPLASTRRIDKGRVMQVLADVLWQVMLRTPRLPTGGGGIPGPTGGGGGLPGDTGAPAPPPPPPPPPATVPPGGGF